MMSFLLTQISPLRGWGLAGIFGILVFCAGCAADHGRSRPVESEPASVVEVYKIKFSKKGKNGLIHIDLNDLPAGVIEARNEQSLREVIHIKDLDLFQLKLPERSMIPVQKPVRSAPSEDPRAWWDRLTPAQRACLLDQWDGRLRSPSPRSLPR